MIISFPHRPGAGGPGSFQRRFERELKERGFNIIYSSSKEIPDIVIVVGGTRKIKWLLKCKMKKIPIVYRLDGINWLHRNPKAHRDLKTKFASEIANLLSKIIHGFIADFIVYQSHFVSEWWSKKGWVKRGRFAIIYNSVNTGVFKPPSGNTIIKPSLICLEGYLDYSPYAIDLINFISKNVDLDFKVYGGIKFKRERQKLDEKVNYMGIVSEQDLPKIYSNSIYLSLDVNAACPNTVIEALACGAPVVGFDTGALKELVPDSAGAIAPYGGDPWKLDDPDFLALKNVVIEVAENFQNLSVTSRKYAVANYDSNEMMRKYLEVINNFSK